MGGWVNGDQALTLDLWRLKNKTSFSLARSGGKSAGLPYSTISDQPI